MAAHQEDAESPAEGSRHPTRQELGFGPSPDIRWRGLIREAVVIGAVWLGLTASTAVLIEFPAGLWSYLASAGSVILVWLVMVASVGRS